MSNEPGTAKQEHTLELYRQDADQEPEMAEDEARERLEGIQNSAKFVYWVLDHQGERLRKDIQAETLLGDSTIDEATSNLKEAGLLQKGWCLGDARKSTYAPTIEGLYMEVVESDWTSFDALNKSTREELEDTTPSAKFMYRVLYDTGLQSSKQITELTGVSYRTVNHGIKQLRDNDLIYQTGESTPQYGITS